MIRNTLHTFKQHAGAFRGIARPLRYGRNWLKVPNRLDSLLQTINHQPHAVYLGDNLAACKTIFGHKMVVNTKDTGVGIHILLDGCWENATSAAFQRIVKPGMNVLEVGANVGYFTLQAASLCGPNGRVWAFEAHPDTLVLLNRNVYANGFFLRVETIGKIAHDHSGDVQFHILDGSPASSSVGEFAAPDRERMERLGAQVRTVTLPSVTVDEVLPPDISLDVVKIDAEGSEPFVLAGMTKALERSPNVTMIVEFYPRNFEMTKSDPGAFLARLQQMGFVLRHIESDGQIFPIKAEQLLKRRSSELLLSRSQSAKF